MIVAIQFSKIIFIFDEHFLVKFDWRFAYSLCVCVCEDAEVFTKQTSVLSVGNTLKTSHYHHANYIPVLHAQPSAI